MTLTNATGSRPPLELTGTEAPGRMHRPDVDPEDALIDESCKVLRLPTIRDRYEELAQAARREKYTYKQFLLDLLQVECADRDVRRRQRLVAAAKFPRQKRIELSGVHLCPSGTSVSVGFTRLGGRWRCAIRGGPTASVTSAAWHCASAENRVG
ncbi:ATP-binding protein [Kitasatospora sp. NPDC048538]|uniref:ATP-binding protein n=1 Tax=unclassified Kitasatospora TaxID=2633591 RepID=UPI0033C1FD36